MQIKQVYGRYSTTKIDIDKKLRRLFVPNLVSYYNMEQDRLIVQIIPIKTRIVPRCKKARDLRFRQGTI